METIQGTQCTVDARSKLREKRFKKKTLPHNLISFSVFVFSRWCSCRKEHSVLVVVLKGRARCTQGGSLLSLGKKCLRIWSECCSQWLHKQLRYKKFWTTHTETGPAASTAGRASNPWEGNESGWWPKVSKVRD